MVVGEEVVTGNDIMITDNDIVDISIFTRQSSLPGSLSFKEYEKLLLESNLLTPQKIFCNNGGKAEKFVRGCQKNYFYGGKSGIGMLDNEAYFLVLLDYVPKQKIPYLFARPILEMIYRVNYFESQINKLLKEFDSGKEPVVFGRDSDRTMILSNILIQKFLESPDLRRGVDKKWKVIQEVGKLNALFGGMPDGHAVAGFDLGQTKQEQDGNNMAILIGTKEQIHQGAQTSISKGELNNLFDL